MDVKFRDWATKSWLLTMIEWHARASHSPDHNTYYLGKHMRQWGDPAVWAELERCFAHFDAADSWQGLLATLDLFRQLSSETAALLGFAYPTALDRNMTDWIMRLQPR